MPNPPNRSSLSPLRAGLRKALLNGGRAAVVGVGSESRGDDAAGLLAAELIRAACRRRRARSIRTFIGGTAPENISGEILRYSPSLIVIIDAADLGLKPGSIRLIPRDRVGGASFSTHAMPLAVLARYLEEAAACGVVIVGIQPSSTEWQAPLAAAVRAAAARVADAVCSALSGSSAS